VLLALGLAHLVRIPLQLLRILQHLLLALAIHLGKLLRRHRFAIFDCLPPPAGLVRKCRVALKHVERFFRGRARRVRLLLAPGLHVDVVALADIVGLEALACLGHERGVVGQRPVLAGGRNGQNHDETATHETHVRKTRRRDDANHWRRETPV
jgi:hypothetical protein